VCVTLCLATESAGGCHEFIQLVPRVLSGVSDHRRKESQLYKLSYVLLFSILAIVTGANSYRGIHTFIETHLGRLNQPALREKAEAAAAVSEPTAIHTSESKGHNRSETRTADVFDASQAVAGTEWQGLVSAIILVTRRVYKRDSKTGLWSTDTATSYYLSSKPVSACVCADAIRAHWGIENHNHYPRDTAFLRRAVFGRRAIRPVGETGGFCAGENAADGPRDTFHEGQLSRGQRPGRP
jgi:hypothetical protein